MKIIRITFLATLLGASTASAEGVISDAMKKFHKGETSTTKHVGEGSASSSDVSALLRAYQDMAKTRPPKGTPASWKQKTDEVISALNAIKSGNKSGTSAFKRAINCKACHDVHRES
jgi:hypothetical protein